MPKQKILCVDDTASNLEVLTELLHEYDVVVSLSGKNALEVMKEIKVDLILLDIMMPFMDGFELCRKIKNKDEFKDIPLLFLSAKNDEISIEHGYELGAVDYINKPFKPKELLARVQTHLKLRAFSLNLEKEVEKSLAKVRLRDSLLVKQKYAASMGQMIDVIAHQWLQPLNILNMRLAKLLLDDEDERVDTKYLKNFQEKSLLQIKHLVQTLLEFRSFMSPDKKREVFKLQDMLAKVNTLLKDDLMSHKIVLDIPKNEDFIVDAIENEFMHILINIINNAKEAFIINNINNRKILITINSSKKEIKISDNAGGIQKQNLEEIFELHLTTKKSSGGSGLGLYLSKMIMDKYGMCIKVSNLKDGTCFSLLLN